MKKTKPPTDPPTTAENKAAPDADCWLAPVTVTETNILSGRSCVLKFAFREDWSILVLMAAVAVESAAAISELPCREAPLALLASLTVTMTTQSNKT